MNSVTFVVVTYNRRFLLEKVLNAIYNVRGSQNIKNVIVVNNCSVDDTSSFLEEYSKEHKNLIVSNTEKNLGGAGGFANGVTVALQTGAEWIGLLDDDVEIHEDALLTISKYMERKTILACLRVNTKGEVVERASRKYDLSSFFCLNPRKESLFEESKKIEAFKELEPVAFASFEGLFVPREVFNRIGIPHSEYFIFGDDCDFCIRARRRNYLIKIVRDAKITRLLPYNRTGLFRSWKLNFVIRNFFILHFLYGENRYVRIKPYFYAALLTVIKPVIPRLTPWKDLIDASKICKHIKYKVKNL